MPALRVARNRHGARRTPCGRRRENSRTNRLDISTPYGYSPEKHKRWGAQGWSRARTTKESGVENLLNELNRRKVFRVGATYLVAAWLLVQVAWTVTEILSLPDWPAITILALVAIGFPIALAIAWFYEFTAEGVQKTAVVDATGQVRQPGRGLSYGVIGLMAAMIGFLVWDGYIREGGTFTSSAATPSIAVLPFADMSPEGTQEYFADGISEEILNLLAKTNGLRVAARTSSFAFKGLNQDIREIGTALDVETVLEGSVRSAGDQLRITAQLINAQDGYHIWSETYNRKLDDVFSVQDEISLAILKALKMHLLGAGTLADAKSAPATEDGFDGFHEDKPHAGNITAYQQLLMGRERMVLRTTSDIKAAARHFEQALAIAPDYAVAHAEYARAVLLLEDSNSTYGNLTREEVDTKAWPHIERAIELNANLAEAYAVKGLYQMNRDKPEDAITSFARAVELNPNYAEAYMWRSMAWGALGSRRQELGDLETAHKLDPISAIVSFNLTNNYADRGRYEEATTVAQETLSYNPNSLLAAVSLASLERKQGLLADSIKTLIAIDDRTDDSRVNNMLADNFLTIGLVDAAAKYIAFEHGHLISWAKGDLEGALALAEIQSDRKPGESRPVIFVGLYLKLLGREEEAHVAALRAYALSKESKNMYDMCDPILMVAMKSPDGPEAKEMITRCEELVDENLGSKIKIANILDAQAGFELALDSPPEIVTAAFEKAYEAGARSWYLNHLPLPDDLANDPGFQAFLVKLNADLAAQRKEVEPLLTRLLAGTAL